jgi:hypothetical protein
MTHCSKGMFILLQVTSIVCAENSDVRNIGITKCYKFIDSDAKLLGVHCYLH